MPFSGTLKFIRFVLPPTLKFSPHSLGRPKIKKWVNNESIQNDSLAITILRKYRCRSQLLLLKNKPLRYQDTSSSSSSSQIYSPVLSLPSKQFLQRQFLLYVPNTFGPKMLNKFKILTNGLTKILVWWLLRMFADSFLP